MAWLTCKTKGFHFLDCFLKTCAKSEHPNFPIGQVTSTLFMLSHGIIASRKILGIRAEYTRDVNGGQVVMLIEDLGKVT
ncbi:hypothetical protein Ct61P_10869 [Colletotrichum tofieldiae]|nr:hypothetical protein Ct61P_10869 [Colletotrichum tofieldiae]